MLDVDYNERRRGWIRLFRPSIILTTTLILSGCIADAFQAVATQIKPVCSPKPSLPWNDLEFFPQFATAHTRSRSALFQSDYAEVSPSIGKGWNESSAIFWSQIQQRIIEYNNAQSLSSRLRLSANKAGAAFKESWWCLPMVLALVPIYTAIVHRAPASMPSWWSVVKLDSVLKSKYAALIVGAFLLSNLSYFLSGLYLLIRYCRPKATNGRPQGYPLLGTFVLAAGAVSTLFHSVQALGPYSIAEGLCYIDHGVAISGIFYFWHKCGKPSRTTAILSIAGLITLSMSGPGYAWLHSVWHILSAAAAVVWARDGIDARLYRTGGADNDLINPPPLQD